MLPRCAYNPAMPSREKLAEFATWCGKHVSGDDKVEVQIFLGFGVLQSHAHGLWFP